MVVKCLVATMIGITKSKASFLVLISAILFAGCSKPTVPDEAKRFAADAIKYGDYYLDRYAKGVEEGEGAGSVIRYLSAGSSAIVEQFSEFSNYNKKEIPLMDKGTGEKVSKCYESLIRYQTSYFAFEFGVTAVYVDPSPKNELEIEKASEQLPKDRQAVFTACEL